MGRTNEGRSPVRVMVMAAEPWELSVVLVTWEGAGARRAPSETSPVLGPSWSSAGGRGGASSDPISKCKWSHAEIEKQKLNSFENLVILTTTR